jgi:hypothetical protein
MVAVTAYRPLTSPNTRLSDTVRDGVRPMLFSDPHGEDREE